MGFDGATTFPGKKTCVQARLKKHAPHAVFVHCHCHLLQLACMHTANSTTGIKHVYTTLTTPWKYFYYSPKRAESLKDIQHVLYLPKMKVIKPSDIHWLSHEWCVKAVKVSYTALVVTLDSYYQNFQVPEALGLYVQGSIQVHHHCSHLSTGLHYTISGQAQQKSSNKTA